MRTMSAGRCDRCQRPWTAGEVVGLGVLKPRPASEGGPWIEFTCPACRTVHRLLPHGDGRYAVPGEPPPAKPSEHERRVPWRRGETGPALAAESAPPAAEPAPRREAPAKAGTASRDARPPRRAPPTRPPAEPAEEEALDVEGARRLLGVPAEAGPDAVEEAFRRHALLCHPDKVAHLDADFQALAARKFRRLQRARDLLVR
jgi:hypothetical protein